MQKTVLSDYIHDFTKTTVLPAFLSLFHTERTRYNYSAIISSFADCLKGDPVECSEDDAKRYVEWLTHEQSLGNLTRNTVRTRISVMKSFFRFYKSYRDKAYVSPFAFIDLPVLEEDAVTSLIPSIKELDNILEASKGDAVYYALLSLLIKTGSPLKDVLSLRVRDVKKKEPVIFFTQSITHPQGRYLRVSDDIHRILLDYIDYRLTINIKEGHEDWLFINRYGKRLSQRSARGNFKKILSDSGIDKPYTLSSVHAASLIMLAEKGTVKELMEYADLSHWRASDYVAAVASRGDRSYDLSSYLNFDIKGFPQQ